MGHANAFEPYANYTLMQIPPYTLWYAGFLQGCSCITHVPGRVMCLQVTEQIIFTYI